VLQRRVSDPRLRAVTVTTVEISPDLRRAHVYVSALGDQEAGQAALTSLNHARGYLRRELGSRLSLRYIPTLTFHLDESLQRSERIMELLRQIEEEATHGQDS
jgi:ribosome-binding factor A